MKHGYFTAERTTWTYTLTDEDIEWTLRMIYGESGNDLLDGACVLWCMTQRLCSLRETYKNKNFTNLIRAYSQPINPLWYREGRLAKVYAHTMAATELKFKRREKIRDMKLSEIPVGIHKLVELWSEAKLPNPVPKAVHFATPGVASKHKGTPGIIQKELELVYDQKGRGTNSISDKGNAYYATKNTVKWLDNMVKINCEDRCISTAPVEDVKKIIISLA